MQYRCDCLKKAVFFINDSANAFRKIAVDDYSTSEAFDKSMQEYGGRAATNRDFYHPEGGDCMIRKEQVRTSTFVHVLGDSTCFLYKYKEDDMAAAKAAHDEQYPPARKFSAVTGKKTNKKSSSFEKGLTWQTVLANACLTEHVGTPTEYSNGGSVKIVALGGATPGGFADELEKMVAERAKAGKYQMYKSG